MSHEAAIRELRRHAGTQFDPELVGIFCDLYANVAPEPDPLIMLMTGLKDSHEQPAVLEAPTLLSPITPSRRRRRRTPTGTTESAAG
jgi:hypothetical protein